MSPLGRSALGETTDRKKPSDTRVGATSSVTRTRVFRLADSGVWST
jgi:hypothetical protein